MKKILAFIAASVLSATAQAELIDFTSIAVTNNINADQTVISGTLSNGIGWTLAQASDDPQQTTLSRTVYDGSTNANGCTGSGLACEIDGIGLGDDEVGDTSAQLSGLETLILAFDEEVALTGFHFLDLFTGTNSEQAFIAAFDSNTQFSTDSAVATAPSASNDGGYFFLGETLVSADFLFFGEFNSNSFDDQSNDFALAGVEVSAVPVPAALPLMASALGMFGIARRRKA